jgi:imidazole glycerol phosphate synthase glutamine amidotransferase subunit
LGYEVLNKAEVAVIDYGIGNLLSVRRGLERCGATVAVTADPDVILNAQRVVLPGVGAFADGMAELSRRKLDSVVREVASRGIPLLGICLGMQMWQYCGPWPHSRTRGKCACDYYRRSIPENPPYWMERLVAS